MPVLNEIAGLRWMLPRIRREWVDQILVIDGGSVDGSVEYALEYGCEVHRQVQPGLRLAYIEAYEKIKGDIMITFSPDGNSIPELLPSLIEEMKKGYDMVIVSRYLGSATSFDDTLVTGLGNHTFTRIINLLFGTRYTDAMVMYRAYDRRVPNNLGITRVRSPLYERLIGRYISWEPQLSVRCGKQKLKVGEIPGDEPRRIGDEARGQVLLPSSRIQHFKSGLACLYMFLDEFLRRRA
jgi:glycosyltransferase involved in cell wall biosynthesis